MSRCGAAGCCGGAVWGRCATSRGRCCAVGCGACGAVATAPVRRELGPARRGGLRHAGRCVPEPVRRCGLEAVACWNWSGPISLTKWDRRRRCRPRPALRAGSGRCGAAGWDRRGSAGVGQRVSCRKLQATGVSVGRRGAKSCCRRIASGCCRRGATGCCGRRGAPGGGHCFASGCCGSELPSVRYCGLRPARRCVLERRCWLRPARHSDAAGSADGL